MKLPSQKKILREDVKDAPNWINPIIDTFNNFAETVYQALNRNITFSENVGCFIKEVTYKTTSNYPVETVFEFLNELKVKATGVLVLQAFERATYTPVAAQIAWRENNGSIEVHLVTGLEASKTYTIRLLVS